MEININTLFLNIPVELLRIDFTYQQQIGKNSFRETWNGHKYLPLVVNYRPKEGLYYIMDGCRRFDAAIFNEKDSLRCIVFNGLSKREEAGYKFSIKSNDDINMHYVRDLNRKMLANLRNVYKAQKEKK